MSNTLFPKYRNPIMAGLYIVLAALIFFLFVYTRFLSGNLKIADNRMAGLQVEIGDEKRVFEGGVVEGMTILEAINASALAGKIKFEYAIDGIDNKLNIISLNGYSKDNEVQNLKIYINDSEVDTGQIHLTLIKPGDMIVIKSAY